MYAVVEIAGKQFRVEKNTNLKVPLLKAESGSKVEFDQVFAFTDDAGSTKIGQPMVKDMKVSATVVEHGRDKKIIVFKKKRRKGYQKKNGHRQGFSLIKIDDIAVVKAAKKAPAKKAETEKPKAEVAEKKAPAAKKAAAPKKETAAKKPAATKKAAPAKKAPAAKKETTTETKAKAKAAPKKTASKAKDKEA